MCSLLIWAKPDSAPDKIPDWQKFKRGDVIEIHDDDNFHWGADVQGPQALGWWRVVVLPKIPAKDLISLVQNDAPGPDTGIEIPYLLRVNTVGLDALEVMEKDQANVAVVTDQIYAAKMTTDKNTLLSVRTTKPALVLDTAALG